MTIYEQLFIATQEMRDFQKSYFQNRLPATLARAKAAELKVDRILAEIQRERARK